MTLVSRLFQGAGADPGKFSDRGINTYYQENPAGGCRFHQIMLSLWRYSEGVPTDKPKDGYPTRERTRVNITG